MTSRITKQIRLDADLASWLEAQAEATGRSQADIIEDALRLLRDPLPALHAARQLLGEYQSRAVVIQDQLQVIADYIVDAHRAAGARDMLGALDFDSAVVGGDPAEEPTS